MASTQLQSAPASSCAEHSEIRRLLPDGGAAPEGLAAHLEHHGALASNRSTREWRDAIVQKIECAGLLGRGGAAFPTGQKLRAVLSQSRQPVVIGNGTEGEPASMKDRVLLARAPHLVLDGATIAADIVLAKEVVMVVHRDVRPMVDGAVCERRQMGIDRIPILVVTASDRFVAGEASAVVNWVDRGRPVPLGKVPRMSERGLGGCPTLVQNVETLAHLALICRHGSEWYRRLGTPKEPGSMLVTLIGSLVQPGVHEVAIGTPVSDILELAGGPSAPLQALLVGGYFGSWLPAAPTMSLSFSAQGLGVGLGAGLLVAFPVGACGVAEAARLARYLACQSAGQCGPCKFGLPAIAEKLEKLAEGRPAGMADLHRWLAEIDGRGACSHPDGVARQIRSALEAFHDEVIQHEEGWCTALGKEPVLPLPMGTIR
jgi:NADH:ubiquinone oxidoreductase subunit F (NADH-binding)